MCLEPPGSCLPRAGVLLGAGGRSEGSGQDSDSVRLTGKEQQWLCSLRKWLWGGTGDCVLMWTLRQWVRGSRFNVYVVVGTRVLAGRRLRGGGGVQSSWGLSAWVGHR